MPQAAANYEPEGWECADIIVEGTPGGVIEELYVEALTLENTFKQLGLSSAADDAANLIGLHIDVGLEPLHDLLRDLVRVR